MWGWVILLREVLALIQQSYGARLLNWDRRESHRDRPVHVPWFLMSPRGDVTRHSRSRWDFSFVFPREFALLLQTRNVISSRRSLQFKFNTFTFIVFEHFSKIQKWVERSRSFVCWGIIVSPCLYSHGTGGFLTFPKQHGHSLHSVRSNFIPVIRKTIQPD